MTKQLKFLHAKETPKKQRFDSKDGAIQGSLYIDKDIASASTEVDVTISFPDAPVPATAG